MYSITEGFSPILCCRPDVITLGNPFDTRVPDYSRSSSFFVFFSKNEEEAIPPGGKKYLGTIKASTRMILVHVCTEDVQNMYRRCTIYSEYYYSERECKGAGTCPSTIGEGGDTTISSPGRSPKQPFWG